MKNINIIEFIFALILICFFVPMLPFLIILIFIFIDKKVFYFQTRIGFNKKKFIILKFSSMLHNKSKKEIDPLENYEKRINLLGKIIRKLHIDEIPQLFNILKGDMSFIGPRPFSIKHNELYKKILENNNFLTRKYDDRFNVKPGIMGLAQALLGGPENEVHIKKRIIYDLIYVKKNCLSLKFFIILKCVQKTLKF